MPIQKPKIVKNKFYSAVQSAPNNTVSKNMNTSNYCKLISIQLCTLQSTTGKITTYDVIVGSMEG